MKHFGHLLLVCSSRKKREGLLTVHHFAAQVVNTVLQKFGYEIGYYRESMSLQAALHRVCARPLTINTVIDVGASDGRWSEVAMKFFPQANYLLIDANPVHAKALEQFKHKHEKVDYVLAAAGDTIGDIFFDDSDPFGGLASPQPFAGRHIKVPVTTIDTQIKERNLLSPYLLKLDTHGFELPIFHGSESVLQKTELIVVEVYNFQLTDESLRFHQMCEFLETKGFRPIDMCSPLHRPHDKALWQFDLLFVRADRPEFQDNHYGVRP